MYFGVIKLVPNELERLPSSFGTNFCYGCFEISFDEPFLRRNRQQLLYQNTNGEVKLINQLDLQIPNGFESFGDFERLLKRNGDYNTISFVYFESSSNSVRIKRDAFGLTTSFYFHKLNQFAYFSTSIALLQKQRGVSDQISINIPHVRKYLDWTMDSDAYGEETIFSKIYNAIPGNVVKISPNRIAQEITENFYKVELVSDPPNEIGNNVRDLFFASLKNKIPRDTRLACHLSGGLDSSSIVSALSHLLQGENFNTFYIDTDTSLTDESYYAHLVAEQVQSIHHTVVPHENIFEASYLHTQILGRPDEMTNGAAMHQSLIKSILKSDCKTIFSGQGGDQVLGYGSEYIHSHYRSGNWNLLKQVFSAPSYQKLLNNTPDSVERELYKTIVSLISQSRKDHSPLGFIVNSIKAASFFKIPFSFFLEIAFRKISDWLLMPGSLVSDELANDRFSRLISNEPSTASNQIALLDKHSITVNEQFYLFSFHYQIQHILPFYDMKLYEYCKSVPAEVKYDMGRRRGHFRQAMKGILPEPVRNRTTKGNFGIYGRKAALLLYNQSRDLLTEKAPVWDFVKKRTFDQSVKLLQQPHHKIYVYNICQFHVFKTINLAIWLDTVK